MGDFCLISKGFFFSACIRAQRSFLSVAAIALSKSGLAGASQQAHKVQRNQNEEMYVQGLLPPTRLRLRLGELGGDRGKPFLLELARRHQSIEPVQRHFSRKLARGDGV